MSEHTQERPTPQLCAGGCGFYGNAHERNLCSKCYREALERDNAIPRTPMVRSEASGSQTIQQPSDNTADSIGEGILQNIEPGAGTNLNDITGMATNLVLKDSISSDNGQGSSVDAISEDKVTMDNVVVPSRPIQTEKDKCWTCSKKIGLITFKCRCGYEFCSKHRYADEHNCDFDYKKHEREQLSRNNQPVVAPKLAKI